MKYLALLLVAVLTAGAQSVIRSGQRMALPKQFTVEQKGLTYVVSGQRQATVISWNEIDTATLARQEPEIEAARQRAVLTGKSTYFTVTPPPVYMRLFMGLPVRVEFNSSWVAISRSNYAVSATGSVQNAGSGLATFTAQGFVSGVTSTRLIDTSRYPLATTIEGLLMTMGDDRKPDSHRLIRELQTQGAFFPNLILGFRNLNEIYPRDPMIPRVLRALDKLSSDQSVSIDAQRELIVFVNYTRKK